jgi:hypothetical protein
MACVVRGAARKRVPDPDPSSFLPIHLCALCASVVEIQIARHPEIFASREESRKGSDPDPGPSPSVSVFSVPSVVKHPGFTPYSNRWLL